MISRAHAKSPSHLLFGNKIKFVNIYNMGSENLHLLALRLVLYGGKWWAKNLRNGTAEILVNLIGSKSESILKLKSFHHTQILCNYDSRFLANCYRSVICISSYIAWCDTEV